MLPRGHGGELKEEGLLMRLLRSGSLNQARSSGPSCPAGMAFSVGLCSSVLPGAARAPGSHCQGLRAVQW